MTTRLKVSLVFGNTPNFDKDAFKYFILSINKIQRTYEFFFPDLESYPFPDKECKYEVADKIFAKFLKQNGVVADYNLAIITSNFDNNYFLKAGNHTAVITTDIWDKYFSPPSVFEYLMHSIICCLIYSQKLPKERVLTDDMRTIYIDSHSDTRGCIADGTRNKYDDRVDIMLGYICEEHQNQIKFYYGEEYLKEILFIIDRKWIGTITEKDTVAYNLNHVFRFNINKDSGFNKTFWQKCEDKFYEIPGNITGEVLKVIMIAIITYLLIKYGIMSKS